LTHKGVTPTKSIISTRLDPRELDFKSLSADRYEQKGSRRSGEPLIEDLNLIRDVRKGERRKSEAALRTASFAQDERRSNHGRIKLIEVFKVPKSRNDQENNVYQIN
jgi:hypothetical protein